ncbi:MAG: cell division protein FtsZ [Chromatiaceae bacterium]|nr:cell division protein FtsZ [Chromatiaceae bacterium]
MFELMDTHTQSAVIKVIGVGGGGGNAVNHMMESSIEGVEFICANTDAQALKHSSVKTILQLGAAITKGLGAGASPLVGRQAAEEDRDRIRDALEGADMVFITAGMGGGTGTGATPVVAEVAKELGILTVAVVTKPFPFEGGKRMKIAEEGIEALASRVDSLITIPNEKLLAVLGKEMSLLNAFRAANDVLLNATRGVAELITRHGLINVDFADVKTVMSEMGEAMMGMGAATGVNRAREAAEAAINSPLLGDIDLSGAKGILVNITAGMDLTIGEFDEVGNTVRDFADEDATVVVGTVIDPDLDDEMRVTVVATGLGGNRGRGSAQGRNDSPRLHVVANDRTTPKASSYADPFGRKSKSSAADTQPDLDYLDIPAFLRRQAD